MRRAFAVVGLAVLALASAGMAFADPTSEATADVFIDIDPNIAITPMFPYIDMGTWQTGEFTGTIPFRVDANTEQVKFAACASNLYKGDDPDAGLVPPIDIYLSAGVYLYAEMGNPIGGDDHNVSYVGEYDVDGFPGWITEEVIFESAQPGHFSQQMDMVVTWTQPDPEKPMGQYSGKVRLMAMVVLFD
jgi:hypothetical protein